MRKMSSGLVPLIQIDRRAREPIHRQIYDAYRTAIVGRALRPKERVPSTRALADELGISRIPVLNAYAQLLAEGYMESRSGAGTFVKPLLSDQSFETRPAAPNAPQGAGESTSRLSRLLPEHGTQWFRGSG